MINCFLPVIYAILLRFHSFRSFQRLSLAILANLQSSTQSTRDEDVLRMRQVNTNEEKRSVAVAAPAAAKTATRNRKKMKKGDKKIWSEKLNFYFSKFHIILFLIFG